MEQDSSTKKELAAVCTLLGGFGGTSVTSSSPLVEVTREVTLSSSDGWRFEIFTVRKDICMMSRFGEISYYPITNCMNAADITTTFSSSLEVAISIGGGQYQPLHCELTVISKNCNPCLMGVLVRDRYKYLSVAANPKINQQ